MAYTHTITTRKIRASNPFARIIWFLFSVAEVIILFRFALKLLAANAGASFTQFVYSISQPLVAPFLFVIPSPQVAGGIVEWASLLALIVYWLVAWGIIELFSIGQPKDKIETREEVERDIPN